MAAWLVSGNSGAYGKAEDLVAPTYVAAADTASPGCLPNGTCALALTITNTNSALKIVSVDGTVTPVFTTSDNAACPSSRSRG